MDHGQLHGVVARLLGIELRCIAGEPFDPKIRRMPRHEGADALRAVGLEMVPHNGEGPTDPGAEVAQAHDDLRAMNRVQNVTRIEARRAAMERHRDRHQARHLAAFREAREDGGAPHRGPRRRYTGPKRETRFVQEGNDAPALTSPLFIRGQSRWSHARISASLRSRACVGGRCGVQPCARSTRPNER